jgi:hypothetical protein
MTDKNARDREAATRELLVRLEERIVSVQRELNDIQERLDEKYVTKKEFAPIQRAVYAAIGLILTAFIGSLIILVFKSGLIP